MRNCASMKPLSTFQTIRHQLISYSSFSLNSSFMKRMKAQNCAVSYLVRQLSLLLMNSWVKQRDWMRSIVQQIEAQKLQQSESSMKAGQKRWFFMASLSRMKVFSGWLSMYSSSLSTSPTTLAGNYPLLSIELTILAQSRRQYSLVLCTSALQDSELCLAASMVLTSWWLMTLEMSDSARQQLYSGRSSLVVFMRNTTMWLRKTTLSSLRMSSCCMVSRRQSMKSTFSVSWMMELLQQQVRQLSAETTCEACGRVISPLCCSSKLISTPSSFRLATYWLNTTLSQLPARMASASWKLHSLYCSRSPSSVS